MGKFIRRALIFLLAAAGILAAAKYGQRWQTEEEPEASGILVQILTEQRKSEMKEAVLQGLQEDVELPESYDYREEGRSVPVRDQGRYGTCWAFASLTALETTLMPEKLLDFSRDHLNFQNHYNFSVEEGGSYIMSVAYLTAWQGPVLEEDDPYGDNRTEEGLRPVCHVQGVRMPDAKDYYAIKQTVYRYGGVESSLYIDFTNPREESEYYSREHSSYCYTGGELSNHDVVIIGWDDHYPAENFSKEVLGDGAFICQNSWGTAFGEDGIFYVSYYDTNIGNYNVAYTDVEAADNYNVIYQSDLCGWTGQIGYNSDTGSFANVYEASEDQELQAVGFYATGADTQYRVAVIPEFQGSSSLETITYTQSGYLQYPGYYTIRLKETVSLKKGQRFAVAVQITTPGVSYPIAVEFASSELGNAVDLTDGEGYISSNGRSWERVEDVQNSNLCLKAYAVQNQQAQEEEEQEAKKP